MNISDMKAPDKIYITPVGTYDTKHIPDLRDNIYIRKDILLEWAKDELKLSKDVECVSEKSYEEGRQQVAQNLIDKLNEL